MPQFEDHGLRGGVWRGQLRDDRDPPARVVLVQHGKVVSEVRLTSDGQESWRLEVDLPRDLLTEGVQTLLLKTDPGAPGEGVHADGELLARLPLMAGRPLDEDLGAELATLRAELELVKRELRRFAAGRAGG